MLQPTSSRALVHTAETEIEAPYFVESQTGGFSVRQITGVLRRNVWLILAAAAIATGMAAYLVSRQVEVYTATAVIRLIDRNLVTASVAPETPVTIGNPDPVQSELMVLTGRRVLGEVVDKEGLRLFSGLSGSPAPFVDEVEITLPADQRGWFGLEFEDQGVLYGPEGDRRRAAYGELIRLTGVSFVVPRNPGLNSVTLVVQPRERAIDWVSATLQAEPMHGTGGVTITSTSTNRHIPPRVVNGVAEVYQVVNADLSSQRIRRQRVFLEEQLDSIDSLLMSAQSELSHLRTRTQSYNAADRFIAGQANLFQVEMQQAQLQTDLRMYENLLNSVLQERNAGQGDLTTLMSMPGISSAPLVSQLFTQLISYRTEREAMVTGEWARAPTHPEVRRLDVLIASSEDQLINAVQEHMASLRAQVGALGGLRGRSLGQMSSLPENEVQEVFLTQNLSGLQQMSVQLREQYRAVRLEEAAEAGQVEIVQLAMQALPFKSSPYLKLLLGLLTGLALGVGLAFLRERMDRSINRPEEIEEMLLLPNLAVIPQASPYLLEANGNGDPHSRIAKEPEGAEAYRILRTNLLFSQGGLKTLVVTSAAPGEGKTMTAVNLAASLARQGLGVLLMECDLRRPSVNRYFDSPEGSDLASVLRDGRPWDQAITPTSVPGLDVLLAGHEFPRAAEFLAGPDMKGLLDEMSKRYDMVILDTSPLLVAADATVLGAIADGVLLVVRASQTDRAAVQQAVHQLVLVGARVVGTVLNDPDGTVGQYGHYYDYSAEYELQ